MEKYTKTKGEINIKLAGLLVGDVLLFITYAYLLGDSIITGFLIIAFWCGLYKGFYREGEFKEDMLWRKKYKEQKHNF